MKIPKMFKKKSGGQSEKAPEPQPEPQAQADATAFDAILAPRAPASAPKSSGAPPIESEPDPTRSGGGSLGDAILAPPPSSSVPPPTESGPPSTGSEPAPTASGDGSPGDVDLSSPPLSVTRIEPRPGTPAPSAELAEAGATDAADDPLAPSTGTDAEPAAADDPLSDLDGDDEEEESGDDLLDIFKETKEETEEGSLASEVDDIAIDDLLSDVVGMSQRLGVTPAKKDRRAAAVEPEIDAPDAPAEEAVVRPADDPEPVETAPPISVTRIERKPGAPATSKTEPPVADAAKLVEPQQLASPQEPLARRGANSPPRQQMLHVVLIGLSLTLAAGLIGIGPDSIGGGSDFFLAGGGEPTPAVLAYLKLPVVPITEITATPLPTPVPTEDPTPVVAEPTPSPTPAATPVPAAADFGFDPLAPAFYNYTVEFGDSLTSISREFGVCPDHILWNNEGRTEYTPLYVGDQLLLPGIPGIVHTVEPGDSIASLAARYSVSEAAIVAFPGNHLKPGDVLKPGSRVLMPAGVPPGALLQDEDEYANTHYPSYAGFVWPYSGPVTTYYGEQRPGYTHNAIDIGGLGTYGQPVVAAASGAVVLAQYGDVDYGNNVVVDHGDGWRSLYAHLEDIHVSEGQTVDISQPLGTIGCTGASTGTHLHFELWRDGATIDPLPILP